MQDLPERNLRHLRVVPSGQELPSDQSFETLVSGSGVQVDESSAPESKGIEISGSNLAAAFQRERQLFKAVRAPAPIAAMQWQPTPVRTVSVATQPSPHAASAPAVTVQEAPQPSTPEVQAQGLGLAASISELGSRFEALANFSDTSEEAQEPDRIDQAMSRLRGQTDLESLLLPTAALRDLSAVNPEATARWLVAMLGSLHRSNSNLRLDLDLRVAIKSATAMGDSTVIDTPQKVRSRSERDVIVRGRPELIAAAVFGRRSWRVRGRAGVEVLAGLAGQPHSLQSLLDDGVDPGPLAIWSLVAASIPAAKASNPFTFVHRTSGNASRAVTVQVAPGRPLKVVAGETAAAELTVETSRHAGLSWAAGQNPAASLVGSESREAEIRAIFEHAFSPIRARS